MKHEILPAISMQRNDDPSIFEEYREVWHQSQNSIYILYLNIADPTISIRSAMTHTPEDANNTTPPSCQPATNVIEKKNR